MANRNIKRSYARFTENRRAVLLEDFRKRLATEKQKGEREIQEDLAGEYNADPRTIQRNINKALEDEAASNTAKVDTSAKRNISSLQSLARWGRDAVARIRHAGGDFVDFEYADLALVAYQLVNDSLWGELARFIRPKAQAEIEALANEAGGSISKSLSLDERNKRNEKARRTIESTLLAVVLSSDPTEWKNWPGPTATD